MRRNTLIISGFVVVLLLGFAFRLSPWAGWLDDKALDQQFRLLRSLAVKPAAQEVIVVGIDNDTFNALPEPMALWHPHIGKLFLAMSAAPAAAVSLDIVLPERSYNFLVPGYDRQLLSGLVALKGKVPVFLGQTVDDTGHLRNLFPPLISLAGQDALGMVLIRPDGDGTVRRYQRYVAFGDTQILTLVGGMAEAFDLDMRDEGLIDYSVGEAMHYVSLQDVLAWQEAGDTVRISETFVNRFVFFGAVLPFSDRHDVPVRLAAWEPDSYHVPGVLIHAQALRSVQSSGLIAPAPAWTGLAAVMLMSLLWWLGGRPVLGVAVTVLAALGLWAGSTWMLWQGTLFPVAGVLVAGLFAVGSRMAVEGALSFREKRRLRRSFSRYVSPHVLNEILAGSLRPELGGERRRVCVLFSDIRGFTTRSENAPPEFTIEFLNRYFEAMTRTIHRYDGTIGTFMGDGIFAFYGAPRALKNPSRNAFHTAQLMLKRLAAFNERIKEEGLEPVSIGIGLHSGDAVIGHVGSESRNEYTAIGDTVNTAARLEGVTKTIGYPVALSDDTAADLDDEWSLIDCGNQAVKGRRDVRVFGWEPGEGAERL